MAVLSKPVVKTASKVGSASFWWLYFRVTKISIGFLVEVVRLSDLVLHGGRGHPLTGVFLSFKYVLIVLGKKNLENSIYINYLRPQRVGNRRGAVCNRRNEAGNRRNGVFNRRPVDSGKLATNPRRLLDTAGVMNAD